MKILKSIVGLAIASSLTLNAQTKSSDKLVSGILINANGQYVRALVLGSTKKEVYYKTNPNSTQTLKVKRTSLSGLFLFDPKPYREARALYKGRKYTEAIEQFKKCQELYKNFRELDDNFYTLSGYYQLECYRKLYDFESLSKTLELFIGDKLTRPSHQTQLAVYKLWDAVHTKNWSRLDLMCKEWDKKQVPISVRTQIEYCHGLALEGLGKKTEALNAYAKAMTADFTKSDSIVRQAALNSLRIYADDEEIKLAMKLWKTEDEDKQSAGYGKLAEANALARIYEKADLGAGVALPSKYKVFLKYITDEMKEHLKEKEDAAKEDSK